VALNTINQIQTKPIHFIFRVSYLEIYNESMVDLLATLPEAINQDNGQAMSVAENQYGVYVKGLSCHLTQNEEEALNYLFEVVY
jgi:kinesin family protein 6/9